MVGNQYFEGEMGRAGWSEVKSIVERGIDWNLVAAHERNCSICDTCRGVWCKTLLGLIEDDLSKTK